MYVFNFVFLHHLLQPVMKKVKLWWGRRETSHHYILPMVNSNLTCECIWVNSIPKQLLSPGYPFMRGEDPKVELSPGDYICDGTTWDWLEEGQDRGSAVNWVWWGTWHAPLYVWGRGGSICLIGDEGRTRNDVAIENGVEAIVRTLEKNKQLCIVLTGKLGIVQSDHTVVR